MKFLLSILLIVLVFLGLCSIGCAHSTKFESDAVKFDTYIANFYPGLKNGAELQRISRGIRSGAISLASLIQVADEVAIKSMELRGKLPAAEEETENSSFLETHVYVELEDIGTDDSETPQRGEHGCLTYNGQECNGPRAGVCDNQTCKCLGGWTGIRCQNEWAVRNYNPYTGMSETGDACAGIAASYLQQCN